ncbi:hypothetical protein BC939DRAFT_299282 [Gamsiella multidivaricata]|uniref:uncharacterized protein n=1 Tax=Gamsiella multidivaricata TaxID=101098 RepID=UPI00221E8FB6|nr:uncharacterized protein BC939DRAFT_299282 [Gamsiella multidivaricata]KAI7818128.1 hypothetical protein BC939DRAFT_299282 [Gamsiella multidivaricata]
MTLTYEDRQDLQQFLVSKGWRMKVSPFEADADIANWCRTGDIVVSEDSDMLIYLTVETVWRPISWGRFLVYDLFEVGKYLEIGRSGLTALGIVSNNDYSKNIFGLGAISNLAVIRDIPWSYDIRDMVQKYLDHDDVARLNQKNTDFEAPLSDLTTSRETIICRRVSRACDNRSWPSNSITGNGKSSCENRNRFRKGLWMTIPSGTRSIKRSTSSEQSNLPRHKRRARRRAFWKVCAHLLGSQISPTNPNNLNISTRPCHRTQNVLLLWR